MSSERHTCPDCGARHNKRQWESYVAKRAEQSRAMREYGKPYSALSANELKAYNRDAQRRYRAASPDQLRAYNREAQRRSRAAKS